MDLKLDKWLTRFDSLIFSIVAAALIIVGIIFLAEIRSEVHDIKKSVDSIDMTMDNIDTQVSSISSYVKYGV